MSESNPDKKGLKRRKTPRLVQERRDRMIEMHASGMGKSKMFDAIADQYHMSRGAVQNDWQKMGRLLRAVF